MICDREVNFSLLFSLKNDSLISSICICPFFHNILSIQSLFISFFIQSNCYLYLKDKTSSTFHNFYRYPISHENFIRFLIFIWNYSTCVCSVWDIFLHTNVENLTCFWNLKASSSPNDHFRNYYCPDTADAPLPAQWQYDIYWSSHHSSAKATSNNYSVSFMSSHTFKIILYTFYTDLPRVEHWT